jgi:hypothetical protein
MERKSAWLKFIKPNNENDFWLINWQIEEYDKKIEKAQKSIYWLKKIISDENNRKEGQPSPREDFDVERIKEISCNRIVKILPSGFFEKNPFRNERSPSNSLYWNKRTNRWTDFGSSQYGSNIDLYMKLNNCDFPTACRELQYMI